MRTASPAAPRAGAPTGRPRLVVVPPAAPARQTSPRERLAALLAGLLTGFLMAALAAAAGGGNPVPALTTAGSIGLLLVAVLVRARIVTVRARRRRRRQRRAVTIPDMRETSPSGLRAA